MLRAEEEEQEDDEDEGNESPGDDDDDDDTDGDSSSFSGFLDGDGNGGDFDCKFQHVASISKLGFSFIDQSIKISEPSQYFICYPSCLRNSLSVKDLY